MAVEAGLELTLFCHDCAHELLDQFCIVALDVLENNGGPIDSLEGEDTHVMVRMQDFRNLEKLVSTNFLDPRGSVSCSNGSRQLGQSTKPRLVK